MLFSYSKTLLLNVTLPAFSPYVTKPVAAMAVKAVKAINAAPTTIRRLFILEIMSAALVYTQV